MPPLLVSVHKESFDFFFFLRSTFVVQRRCRYLIPARSRPAWMELWPICGRCPCLWQGLGTKWCLRSLPFVNVFQKYLPCKLPKVLNQALWQYMIPIARTGELPPTSGNTAPSALIHHVRNPAVLLKHLWCAANSLVWNKKIHYAQYCLLVMGQNC